MTPTVDVERTCVIDAPPEAVFALVADPAENPSFTPSLVDITDVEATEIGKRGRYVFRMLGLTTEGTFEDVAFERPTRRRYELAGDIRGIISWRVDPSNGGSRVRYRASFEVPGPPVVNRVAVPFVRRFARNEADALLSNLRERLETDERRT